MLEPMKKLCNPVGVMSRGKIPSKFAVNGKETEREAIFVLVTVGQEISDTSTEAFTQGDYVKGMLAVPWQTRHYFLWRRYTEKEN